MKYLLDSNLLIYSARPEPQFVALRSWVKRPDAAVSALSQVEVVGYHAISASDELYFLALLRLLPQLASTEDILKRAVQIRQQFRLKTPDAIIAATALQHSLVLVSADNGFSRVAELELISPLTS